KRTFSKVLEMATSDQTRKRKRGQWKKIKLEDFEKMLKEQKVNDKIRKIIHEKGSEEMTLRDALPAVDLNYLMERNVDYCDIRHFFDVIDTLKSEEEMKVKKIFSDPIHGQFEVHPACEMIIDTPQFQRLRFLKKIGTCYFVFPGASHNRFEHALGVCHLAGKFVRTLRQNQPNLGITHSDMLCVQIGGLCCSIGYGPFSRLYEESFLPQVKNQSTLERRNVLMLKALLKHRPNRSSNGGSSRKQKSIKELLQDEYGLQKTDIKFIKEIIGGPSKIGTTARRDPHKAFLYEIVYNKRNSIDAYRWDYLARDCHNLGLKNSFDHLRYMQMARVIDVDGELQICIRDKELINIHNLFYTRYLLVRTAYNHKVNCAIEMMINEAMLKSKDIIVFKSTEQNKEIKLCDCHTDMEAYTQLTDNIIFKILSYDLDKEDKGKGKEKDLKEAKELIRKVLETRDLYTCVFESNPFAPELLNIMAEPKGVKTRRKQNRKRDITNVKEMIKTKILTKVQELCKEKKMKTRLNETTLTFR
ncbi:deoxynucleoside triphosphate triphosphohydrolase SAMHD1-like isoform X1, partial [Biomphalaria pfeifferi]